jgi:hypothetical protein
MVPAIYFLVSNFGAIGAAWAWVSYGVAGWAFGLILIAPLFSRVNVIEYFRVITMGAFVAAILAFGQYFISSYLLEEFLWIRILLAVISFFLITLLTMLTAFGASGLRNLFGLLPGKN